MDETTKFPSHMCLEPWLLVWEKPDSLIETAQFMLGDEVITITCKETSSCIDMNRIEFLQQEYEQWWEDYIDTE
jgi:hypothetical protein